MTNQEIKTRGRTALKANYWPSVVAALLMSLLAAFVGGRSAGATQENAATLQDAPTDFIGVLAAALGVMMVISILLKIFVFNPLEVGCHRFFRQNVADPSTKLGVIKEGFNGYGRVFCALFLRDIFLCLWSLLFIIPGIVMSYAYRLVPYILRDEPELSAMEAIRRSKELMKGNKGRAFLLDLSFIGWFLLSAVTFGILNVFWTNPYYENAKAAFYLDVKGE